MPDDRNPAATRADAEALEWIVALQEAPGDADVRAAFEQWLRASGENADAWEETAQVYAGIGGTQPVHGRRWEKLVVTRKRALALPIMRARSNRRTRQRFRDGDRSFGRLARIALPFAATAMLAVIVAPDMALRWQADAMARTGELREIKLADGSHASLSSGGALKIDYSDTERRITLLRGQAWFDVHDEAKRPFRVVVHDVVTTDIGTAFEVGLSDDSIHVAVEHGVVRVDDVKASRAISERLVAGQSLAIGSTGIERGSTSPELVAAWRQGQLAVHDRPMREVIEALRPWYGGLIVVRSDVLASKRVTGVYDLRDPASAMEALARAYGGSVIQLTPWLLILSDG